MMTSDAIRRKFSHFYSLYSLKLNRVNNGSLSSPTVTHYLDREVCFNKDFSISLIKSDLPPKNEPFLRECIARKIERGTFYLAINSGNISNFGLGLSRNDPADSIDKIESVDDAIQAEKPIDSICYFYLFRQKISPNNEYLICFVMADAEHNLDLFRNELDSYIENHIQTYLEDSNLKEMNTLETNLKEWFSRSIEYLWRAVDLLKDDSTALLTQAISNGKVKFENFDDQTKLNDLKLFAKAFECKYLFDTFDANESMAKIDTNNNQNGNLINLKEDEKCLVVSLDNGKVVFSRKNGEKIGRIARSIPGEIAGLLFRLLGENNPFDLKQVVESFKLMVIQDLNRFNRLLRKAESNYYDLYKVYLYLEISDESLTEIVISIFDNFFAQLKRDRTSTTSSTNLIQLFETVIFHYRMKMEKKKEKKT